MEFKIILGDTLLTVSDIDEEVANEMLAKAGDTLRSDLGRIIINMEDMIDYNSNRIYISADLVYDKEPVKKTRLVCSRCAYDHNDPVRCYHITPDNLFSIICGCKAPLEYEEEAPSNGIETQPSDEFL